MRLLAADDDLGAMLLERCKPGTTLRVQSECDQDVVISGLLRRLWRSPATPHSFRSLARLTEYWTNATLKQIEHWPDAGLVREGLHLFKELPRNATRGFLLATDLHAGNVLPVICAKRSVLQAGLVHLFSVRPFGDGSQQR